MGRYDDIQDKLDNNSTVNVLLNIDNFAGESEGRLTPWLIYLSVCAIPCFIYISMLYLIMPLYIFIVIEALFAGRMYLKIILNEAKRLEKYKKQKESIYSSAEDLLGIKRIRPDGLVIYNNNKISYFIVVDNGNIEDKDIRIERVTEFLENICDKYEVDFYIQNIDISDALYSRYSAVRLFKDKEAIADLIDVIDYNIEIYEGYTVLDRVVFEVKGRKYQYKEMRRTLEELTMSDSNLAYKDIRIADKELAIDVIERDLYAYIDFNKMLKNKYKTSKFYGSKIIGWDNNESNESNEEVKASINENVLGFIPREEEKHEE